MRRGKAHSLASACVSVCLSVCSGSNVWMLWPTRFVLVRRHILRISRSRSSIEVMGSSSNSYERNQIRTRGWSPFNWTIRSLHSAGWSKWRRMMMYFIGHYSLHSLWPRHKPRNSYKKYVHETLSLTHRFPPNILPRDTSLHANTVYAIGNNTMSVHPPVCLSVTVVFCIKTAKNVMELFLSGSCIILVLSYKTYRRNSDAITLENLKCR